jgi:hypothetical protein
MRSWLIALTILLVFAVYYERIMFAEEEFLRRKFGRAYLEWAANTPAFIPRFRNWHPAELPFSLKKVLRREYSGFFAIIVSFTLLEIISDFYVEGRFEFDRMWIIILAAGAVLYVLLRTLKKKSGILHNNDTPYLG